MSDEPTMANGELRMSSANCQGQREVIIADRYTLTELIGDWVAVERIYNDADENNIESS